MKNGEFLERKIRRKDIPQKNAPHKMLVFWHNRRGQVRRVTGDDAISFDNYSKIGNASQKLLEFSLRL